jgi:SAM-dependent methyltransferase
MIRTLGKVIRDPIKYGRIARYQLVMKWYLFRYDHTEGYRRIMRYRIKNFGPEQAVGGFDSGIGRLQFEFLKEQGLSPSDTVLDIGCGTLRGGEHFIHYLDAGHYTGMDISEEAIDAGIERLGDLVEQKNPTFVVNDDLTFGEVTGEFDYAIAQSVFTHLPLADIHECLANIDTVVDGTFYATFFDEPVPGDKNFGYDPKTLVDIGAKYGHDVELLPPDAYPHPEDQRMMRFDIN